jgi:hypothetical protein
VIDLSKDLDLGRDHERMSDAHDAPRQAVTTQEILRRFYADREEDRTEIQMLADEVGMGKTFVALAAAYSVLQALSRAVAEEQLKGCYKKILVLTPANDALFRKWIRETSEIVKRCVPGSEKGVGRWFSPVACDRVDELIVNLRKPNGPPILVMKTSRLESGKLQHRGEKHQFMLAALCRYWGIRLPLEDRDRLLKGAPDGWPRDQSDLGRFLDDELLHFDEEDFLGILRRLEHGGNEGDQKLMTKALEAAKDLATPYRRDRVEGFATLRTALSRVYTRACFGLIKQDLPLVIVDEAHNWKNGPRGGANAFYSFRDFIAPRTRRLLLLSATPFQLRPQEMIEILKASDHLSLSQERCEALRKLREGILGKALRHSEVESREFAKVWARLPRRVRTEDLAQVWSCAALASARKRLDDAAAIEGVVDVAEVEQTAKKAVVGLDPDVRGFFVRALTLYARNRDLSCELGRVVIRHRRDTQHRVVRVGEEFAAAVETAAARPDRMVMHVAPGLSVEGDAELPHYLLMRAVSELKGGKGRTALGTALTGTYSTLAASAEGSALRRTLEAGPASLYLGLLRGLVGEAEDPRHPKVRALVDQVFAAWERGEKYLIFCFRSHTAKRLRDILRARIEQATKERRRALLGSETALDTLRGRVTGRDRDLMPLVLDRVLWSYLYAHPDEPLGPDELLPQKEDFAVVAGLALRYGINLAKEQLDRVFLHRAIEHASSKRLLRRSSWSPVLHEVLERMADVKWVEGPYGLTAFDPKGEDVEEALSVQTRGVQTLYEVHEDEPARTAIEAAAANLWERDRATRGGHRGIVRGVVVSPNLWLGPDPPARVRAAAVLGHLHRNVWALMKDGRDDPRWMDRLLLFNAFRRAVLREAMLIRLLPTKSQRDEAEWGTLLAEAVMEPLPKQSESFLQRLDVFVEDFVASSGSARDTATARGAFMSATTLKDDSLVSLVDGSTKQDQRDRVFSGFNTPFLPDVLICTSVGQEGIDLHRHCRHVAHYDLAWNPATIEQRTGRTDRIGSKTFRERDVERRQARELSFLSVGIPYLAGTYDERIYEEVRVRAQTFEVLTGGEFAADHAEGSVDGKDDEGDGAGLRALALPAAMLNDIRVKLEVYLTSDVAQST